MRASPSAAGGRRTPGSGPLRILRRLEPLLGVVLFGLAMAALHRELAGHGLREIGRVLGDLPADRLAAALGLTGISYGLLTLYDMLALHDAGRRLPYRVVAPASFVSEALGHNLGMAALTSAPMRFRFYSAAGLETPDILRIVLFVGLTFWLGVVSLAGLVFLVEPPALPAFWPGALAPGPLLGGVLLLLPAVYLAGTLLARRPVRLGAVALRLPAPATALLQIPLAVGDLAASAGVLWLLLPPSAGVSFAGLLAVYMLALLAGILSQVPGGLGVFEAVVVMTLPTALPASAVLATLLAYRAVYYVVPLLAAGGVLATFEAWPHRGRLATVWRGARDWTRALAPHAAAAVTLLAGAVLLFSGALPGLPHRLSRLGRLAPLPVIELSHLAASLVGLWLLLVARGLQRRLDGAWVLALVLLAAGIVTSLAKGLDYEEASILAVVLLLLLPARSAFYRKGALLAERFTARWLAAIVVVVGASFWLGMLSYRHAGVSAQMWWQFALHGDASRALRASVAVAAVALATGLAVLLAPARRRQALQEETTREDLERAAAVVARSTDTRSHLALVGDKRLLLGRDGSGFIMYAVSGRSWIAMGDPIGPPAAQRDLAWEFVGLVDRYDGWPVFYEARPGNVPLYLDLGLSLLKLGEEAIVPLAPFSLEGAARKGLRHAWRRAARSGCVFSVVPARDVSGLLPELRAVSDRWLAARRTGEKGFSLGSFEPDYLRRGPLAVARRGGALVAFANIWSGAGREEIAIDLMRHTEDAPPGTMDFLLCELMLWARSRGYAQFNLGMAPMSGLETDALAPLWSKVGAFVFRHAESYYNFQGLRAFKEKYDPRWEPRFLASPGGLALPRILTALAGLIGGGVRGVLGRRGGEGPQPR